MGRNDNLLSMLETKEELDCSVRHINRMVRDGKLVALFPNGARGGRFFRKADVQGLAKAGRGSFDFNYVTATSEQALAMAQQVSNRLSELCTFLGLECEVLTADEDGLKKYFEMQHLLDRGLPTPTFENTMALARMLNAIDEPYLTYLARRLASEEPWRPFYEAANVATMILAAGDHTNPAMLKALGFLIAARNNLRTVAYFYERGKHTKKYVDAIFPEKDPDAGVLACLSTF